jgi:SAM-dependent methyltransferase
MTSPSTTSREQIHEYWRQPDETNDYTTYTKGAVGRSLFLLKKMRSHATRRSRILELGCNAGRNLAFLHHGGFRDLNGIEINENAVTHLRKTFPELKNAHVIVSPIEEALLEIADDAYDMVFSMAVLEHIHPESEWIFSEISRITPAIMTIEDEERKSGRHFPRQYLEIFTGLGLDQIENLDRVPGLPKGFRYRLFRRSAHGAG